MSEEKKATITQQATFAGSTLLTMGLVDLVAHLGPTGLLIGGIASYVAWKHGPEIYEQARGIIPLPAHRDSDERTGRSFVDRALGRHPVQEQEETEVSAPDVESLPDDESAAFVSVSAQTEVPGVPRITVEQIARHTQRNSYEVYIGRSMTRPNNPAVKINFYRRHLKLIGASQHGKSSMAAALLDAITSTHNPELVQIAILDLEDKTGRLFADVPHVARVRFGERMVRLHARSYEQVLEHLGHVSTLIDYRYGLAGDELEQQPLVIVYLEEFVDLKDYFKQRVSAVERDEQEQARQDYARLVYYIKKIAARGLKVHIQLLMCAQVDYRDDDLQAALVNVTSGMSFCVRTSAAQAAGFYQTELLQRNAREDKVGQAVCEMPDCKDLILAPEYDLMARLRAFPERFQVQPDRKQGNTLETPKETATEANSGLMGNVSEMANDGNDLSTNEGGPIGNDIRETVKRLRQRGLPLREIAPLVGMAGRKYEQFKRLCDEEGL